MKTLAFTLLLLIPVLAYGQKKGDNTIIVTTDKENLYSMDGQGLISLGYDIKDSNPEWGAIATDYKIIGMAAYRVNVSINNNIITIRGKWKNDIGNGVFNTQNQEYDVVYSNKKLNGNTYIFANLMEFAELFEGEIEFK